MLSAEAAFYLLVPDSSQKRLLRPGKVLSCEEGVVIAELDESVTLPKGTEVVAFACVRNKFMQQGAVVVAQSKPGTEKSFAFKLVGEAVSAENRQTYRVSVAAVNMKAHIGRETDCMLCDVSAEGFAAITCAELKIGTSVQVNFSYEGQTVSAAARVQTMKPRPDGKFRYGFLIPQKISPARKALSTISASIQRRQLKRLAAA